MDDPRWERMWTLFHAALALAPNRRTTFLDTECGDDATLRRQVAELLASHDRTSGPLDRSPAEGLPEPTVPAGVLVGERIGPYRVLGRIGEGGMGVVYDAEQESPIRRRVALKAIHPGMHPDAAARFAVERQALALMSHPNIARVFDAGVLPDGRPFLAMEHVAGVPLGEYCDRHALDLDRRLEVFVSVCQALQHAHQKSVIHRDIKPSNILVAVEDGAPTSKVIDFGVAKALHPTVDDQGLRTRQETLIGTLEYMSPEQLDPSGLDVDTRSDIYSLGVVLYELLSGTLPFDWPGLRREGLEGLRRVAREEDPPKASRRFSNVHPAVATNLNNLGLLLHDQGRLDEAAALFREALEVQRQKLPEGHPDLAYPTTNLARVLHDQGRLAQAEALYERGLTLRRAALPAGHAALGDSLAWLGKLLTDQGRPAQAEPLLREAVAVRAAAYTADDWRTAEARSLLGACLGAQGRFAEAEGLLLESYPVIQRRRGPRYHRTVRALERVVALYEAWGRPEDAARHRAALERGATGR